MDDVGHSNGGDISMYFAQQHPEMVSQVITLDNLRVPFVLNEKAKILSFPQRIRISKPIPAYCRPSSRHGKTVSISSKPMPNMPT